MLLCIPKGRIHGYKLAKVQYSSMHPSSDLLFYI